MWGPLIYLLSNTEYEIEIKAIKVNTTLPSVRGGKKINQTVELPFTTGLSNFLSG